MKSMLLKMRLLDMLRRGPMTLAKMAPNDDLSDLQKSRGNQCLVFNMVGE